MRGGDWRKAPHLLVGQVPTAGSGRRGHSERSVSNKATALRLARIEARQPGLGKLVFAPW